MECQFFRRLQLTALLLIVLGYNGVEAVKITHSKIDLATVTENQSIYKESLHPTTEIEDLVQSSTEVTANDNTNSVTMHETTISYLTEWPEFPPKIKTMQTVTSSEIPTTKHLIVSSTSFTTPKPSIKPRPTDTIHNKTDLSTYPYCSCNLEIDQCDLNCCCDPDCNIEIQKVFNCPIENATVSDDIIEAGKPSATCEANTNWFCLFHTEQQNHPTKDLTDADFDTSHQYTWTNFIPLSSVEEEQIHRSRDYYKINEPIKILKSNSKEIRYIEVPIDFRPPFCHLKEPIRHLTSFRRSCLITTAEELQEIEDNLINVVKHARILNRPNFSNSNNNPDDIVANSKPIEILTCSNIEGKCFSTNPEKANILEQQIEQYLLNKILINISHNYTQLAGMSMELWFQPKPNDTKTFAPIWLNFEIKFQSNRKQNYNKIISGPLGYLLDKPVLISKMLPYNKSLPLSKENQILSYFDNRTHHQHILRVIDKHRGFCQQAKKPRHLISYGINMAIRCKLQFSNTSVLNEAFNHLNFTNICQELQRDIYNKLLNTNQNSSVLEPVFISQLGRPKNQTDTWLPLTLRNMLTENSVVPQYNEVTNTFICHNIQLSAAYEFHIGKFPYDGIPHQQMIKKASVDFGRPYDLEFTINETIIVPIMTTVRFYDLNDSITSKALPITKPYHIYLFMGILLKTVGTCNIGVIGCIS